MNLAEFNERLGLTIEAQVFDDLTLYCSLITKWNPSINLVSRTTIADIWLRHIVDAAQLYPLIPSQAVLRVDMGSGGGLPGIVLALIARQFVPDARHILIESDQRKAAFLREVIRHTGLTASVRSDRIEAVPPLGCDLVTARALAPLDKLLGLIAPHLAEGGVAILPKGEKAESELAAARVNWMFELESQPSITDPQARILRITKLSRRPGVTT